MTTPSLFTPQPVCAEELIAAWLAPLRRSGVAFRSGDPLPFTLVTRIGGEEDFWIQEDEPIVSVHTLCDLSLGYAAAKTESEKTHNRLLELGWTLGPVNMPDGSQVAVEYLMPIQHPRWLDYEDVRVLRKVGRYKIGIPYL